MWDLIHRNKAPVGAVVPRDIEHDGLFELDVDDDIWQDVGLDETHDDAPPQWLSDEGVHEGIKALLEYDRCVEEEVWLVRERCAMQDWMLEEWNVNSQAQQTAGSVICTVSHCSFNPTSYAENNHDYDILYQLQLQKEQLCRLCAI